MIQTDNWAESVFWVAIWSPTAFYVELLALREALMRVGCGGTCTKSGGGVQGKKHLRVENALSNP